MFNLWVAGNLPAGLRIIRYDKRGHGLSDVPAGPYSMGTLVSDAEKLMDRLGVKDALFVGLSIGGMIAQGLSVKRPDLVRALLDAGASAISVWHEKSVRLQSSIRSRLRSKRSWQSGQTRFASTWGV